jgi:hypothetical protein
VDDTYRRAVEEGVGRPFDNVQQQLIDLFGQEWDEILVVLETAATKRGQTHAEVIAGLLERSERKPSAQTRVKRGIVRWIGKPWRERDNPWDRFKGKVPPAPPRIEKAGPDDLDEWTPLRPDDEG